MDKLWYTNELKKVYSQLLDIREKDGSNDKLDLIIKVIENTFQDDIKENIPFNTIIKDNLTFPRHFLNKEYKIYTKTSFLWPYIDIFSKHKYNYKHQKENKLDLSNDELIYLTSDFYQNGTNKKVYEIFIKLLNNSKFHFIEDNSDINFLGDCVYLPYYEKYYVQIVREPTFSDIATISHEFGHGIQMHFNPSYSIYSGIYVEIVSSFMELLCYEYFSYIKYFKKDALQVLQETYTSTIDYAIRMQKELNILKEISSSNNHILNSNIKKFFNENPGLINDIIYENPTDNYIYIIGLLIAIELFIIYLNDSDKSFYYLFKIMNISANISSKDYFNRLLTLGINPCENLYSFDNYLKRRLTK